jgi:hypothetical protein
VTVIQLLLLADEVQLVIHCAASLELDAPIQETLRWVRGRVRLLHWLEGVPLLLSACWFDAQALHGIRFNLCNTLLHT